MSDIPVLTVSFLEKHPAAAARALLEISTKDAASFLETLPTKISANVLTHFGMSSAAVVLSQMTPISAAAVLRTQDYLWTSATLRLVPVKSRKIILEELPQKLKHKLEKTLAFPSDTVGAAMTSSLIMMTPDHTIAEAKAELQRLPKALPNFVFVIRANRRFLGVVRTVTIFRHADKTTLKEAMETDIAYISARSRLSSITGHADWQIYNALPVVSRQKHLIGAIHRDALRRESLVSAGAEAETAPVILSLLETFMHVCTGLGEMLLNPDKSSPKKTKGMSS